MLKQTLQNNELREKADALIESGADVLDLRHVAAQLHVLSAELSENRHEDKGAMPLLLQCLESARKTAESVERIRASKAFTNSERDYMGLAWQRVIERLPPEVREQAVEDFRAELMLQPTSAPPLPMASETV